MAMATSVNVEFQGFKEFEELATKIADDFGYKDAQKIMVSAARMSLRSALVDAQSRAPVDTGALQASLQIEARKPTSKDKRSKYISQTDVAIAAITTAPGKKLAKTKFQNQRTGTKQIGIKSDARVAAMEFGTAKVSAKPFLRPALESNSNGITSDLGKTLGNALEKYKARQATKAKI
jgi:HK97 gp10 family phage protein